MEYVESLATAGVSAGRTSRFPLETIIAFGDDECSREASLMAAVLWATVGRPGGGGGFVVGIVLLLLDQWSPFINWSGRKWI